jgi:UDP-glucose 4-epimerase
VLDLGSVRKVLRQHRIDGVVHVAGKKRVDESVRRPLFYYRQNVEGLRVLLEAVVQHGAGPIVFSSSAAVYGSPDVDVVTETVECRPMNPYGRSKLIGEHMIADIAGSTGLRYANLRYFNVAGTASPALADRGATNLIPTVFRDLGSGRPPRVFGRNYATADGTCVRDFVHVLDIASAHVATARALARGEVENLTLNVGRGEGVSVREMVSLILRVTGTAAQDWARPVYLPRRPGDPARVVAAADAIGAVLGWRAQWDVQQMVASDWEAWLLGQRDGGSRPMAAVGPSMS